MPQICFASSRNLCCLCLNHPLLFLGLLLGAHVSELRTILLCGLKAASSFATYCVAQLILLMTWLYLPPLRCSVADKDDLLVSCAPHFRAEYQFEGLKYSTQHR